MSASSGEEVYIVREGELGDRQMRYTSPNMPVVW